MKSSKLALSLAASTALFVFSTFGQDVDTLNIIHTSDTHIVFNLDKFHPVLAEKRMVVRSSIDSLEAFFKSIPKQVKADAVVITGDMLDIYEGETEPHKLLADQIEQFRSLYDECPVPLYLTLGNHDISKYTVNEANSSLVVSQLDAGRARASWIRTIPCFNNGTYYAKVFQVGRMKYRFIFLENGYSLHEDGKVIDKGQLDWLNDQVTDAGGEAVILFFHIYFSVGDINGDGVSFKENGPLDWPSEKQCSEGLLKLLNEKKNIKAMVVGHGHANVFEGIHFPSGHTIYQIETGSVTEGHLNWRLFQCTENGITVTRPGSKKAEIMIDLNEKGE
jgi:3',5'-cyclic AMP phosphodiesterase CpdA